MSRLSTIERRFLYNLLSDIFILKPDEKFLKKIAKKEHFDFFEHYFLNSKDLEILKHFLNETIKNKDKLSDLQTTFESTFVIPVPKYFIPPMMSAFVNYQDFRENNTFHTLAEELQSIYTFFNVNFNNTPDHISVIFAFMSMLVGMEEENIKNFEKKFFFRYIDSWVDKFFSKVSTKLNSTFYVKFTQLASEFIKMEKELLQEE